MGTYTLTGGDIATLNEGADLAADAAKAAKREAAKAFLDDGVRIAEQLEGYAEEAKAFLKNVERGKAELSKGHVDALAVGMRILYVKVKKLRADALDFFVNAEGHDVRLQEIRDTTRKLRTNVQLEIEDEAETANATPADTPVAQTPVREPSRARSKRGPQADLTTPGA